MLHVNDDMDELFQKAAEGYPLNTSGSDWETLRGSLQQKGLTTGEIPNQHIKRRALWLLLLLALPATWIAVKSPFEKRSMVSQAKYEKSGDAGLMNPRNEHIKNNSKDQALLKQVSISETKNLYSQNHSNVQPMTRLNGGRIHHPIGLPHVVHKTSTHRQPVAITTINPETEATITLSVHHKIIPNNIPATTAPQLKEEPDVPKVELQFIRISGSDNDSTSKFQPPVQAPELKLQTKTPTHFFYAGIIGGLDASTIKLQLIKHPGTVIGILLGYQFNQRISFETGLLKNKKYYYTDGKYFNAKGIYLPADAKIIDLTGDCKMLELPLNVKYNFNLSGKTRWFSVLGVSAYFMKEQDYDYNITHNGYQYNRYAEYPQHSNTLFSVLNLGGGVTREIGMITIRVEPYLKIPLKGIGVGQLNITSVGLNIGLTKKF